MTIQNSIWVWLLGAAFIGILLNSQQAIKLDTEPFKINITCQISEKLLCRTVIRKWPDVGYYSFE